MNGELKAEGKEHFLEKSKFQKGLPSALWGEGSDLMTQMLKH